MTFTGAGSRPSRKQINLTNPSSVRRNWMRRRSGRDEPGDSAIQSISAHRVVHAPGSPTNPSCSGLSFVSWELSARVTFTRRVFPDDRLQ
uniref:Uncharacterized protein n=1 Tax=Setaria viridis TaxID=4556 RepID=A0A4U6VEZ2_SETVI|nr:hypothetical protein SEVIR_3G195250v2 [Setaria viridis]